MSLFEALFTLTSAQGGGNCWYWLTLVCRQEVECVGKTWDRTSACDTDPRQGFWVGCVYSLLSPPVMTRVRAGSAMMHIICSRVNTHMQSDLLY